MVFGVPQKSMTLGASIDGEYFVNNTKDYFVKSSVSGNIYTENGYYIFVSNTFKINRRLLAMQCVF